MTPPRNCIRPGQRRMGPETMGRRKEREPEPEPEGGEQLTTEQTTTTTDAEPD